MAKRLNVRRIRGILEPEGATSRELFCTVHALNESRIAVIYSSHPTPEWLGGWQPYEQGVVGQTARTGKVTVVPDVGLLPDYLGVYPGVASEMAIPVIARNGTVAIVNFESTERNFFFGKERRFRDLASQVSDYFGFGDTNNRNETLVIPEHLLITARPEERIYIEVSAVSDALLRDLAEDPSLLHALTPRKFEELVGRILEDLGYSVTLTPIQKDGGYDLLAETRLDTGRVLTLVECKKWSPTNPVGIEIVRNLYGVLTLERATNAMIVTTSRFTKDAKRKQDTLKYQLSLRDYKILIAGWRATELSKLA
jgi:hypothetical protein